MRAWSLRKSLVVGLTLCFLPFAHTAWTEEIYKWVDEDGVVHFSDCEPPPGCEAEVVEVAPPPDDGDVARARQRLDNLLAQQQASAAARREKREADERERQETLDRAVELQRECAASHHNLRVLKTPRPVYSIDASGEHVYLTDDERAAEILRLEQFIEAYCATR